MKADEHSAFPLTRHRLLSEQHDRDARGTTDPIVAASPGEESQGSKSRKVFVPVEHCVTIATFNPVLGSHMSPSLLSPRHTCPRAFTNIRAAQAVHRHQLTGTTHKAMKDSPRSSVHQSCSGTLQSCHPHHADPRTATRSKTLELPPSQSTGSNLGGARIQV